MTLAAEATVVRECLAELAGRIEEICGQYTLQASDARITARRSMIVQVCAQIVQISVTRPNTTRSDSQAVWLHEGHATRAAAVEALSHLALADSFIGHISV